MSGIFASNTTRNVLVCDTTIRQKIDKNDTTHVSF